MRRTKKRVIVLLLVLSPISILNAMSMIANGADGETLVQMYETSFTDEAVSDTNRWVSEQTDGCIPEVMDQIPKNTMMYLIIDCEHNLPIFLGTMMDVPN